MAQVPVRVADRLIAGIKRFQPILASAKARDVNESDTVILVTDMLSEVFGYDKYSEITSECSIRGTFCDLGIKIGGSFQFLIEVKAIGLELKHAFTKQAIDYSANQGTEWVMLTNGETWRAYRVSFSKPIDYEQVLEINLSQVNPKNTDDIERLYHLTKEGWLKSVLGEFHMQQQALNRFSLAAMITSQPVLEVIRRGLRKLSPDIKIDVDQIKNVMTQEVLKREVVEGEKAEEAKKKINRYFVKSAREKTKEPKEVLKDPDVVEDIEQKPTPAGAPPGKI
ncbi:MAG: restriction endonuclease subunit R [Deltaproteobacteria bacterium]|nr:restriction endonuclease subunit R [Deltaproteobacteria bacterium]